MGLSIRDAATEGLVRALAKRKGVGLTEAVRIAVGTELQRLDREPPLRERVAAIRKSIIARGRTGKRADKAFFDDLSGERRCFSTPRRSSRCSATKPRATPSPTRSLQSPSV